MDELQQRLIEGTTSNTLPRTDQGRSRSRLTLVCPPKGRQWQPDPEEEAWEPDRKMYHSIIQEPACRWNQQELMERTLILEGNGEQSADEFMVRIEDEVPGAGQSRDTGPSVGAPIQQQARKRKTLNSRLFTMSQKPQKFIYYFNLFFNILFRIGLVFLLLVLEIYGDGDPNRRQEEIFISVLLGLEFIIALLYFVAITKILYTKSCDISVYFQKQFYEKPYSEIRMERILRKHFTATKMVSNLYRLANPFTKFNKDIRVAVFKQEVYKRMELMMVFLPLMVVFIMGTPWFDRGNQSARNIDIQLLMGIVVCIQAVRTVFHYLFVYIFS